MTLAVVTLLPNIFDIDCRAPHVLRTIIVVFRRRALIAFVALKYLFLHCRRLCIFDRSKRHPQLCLTVVLRRVLEGYATLVCNRGSSHRHLLTSLSNLDHRAYQIIINAVQNT